MFYFFSKLNSWNMPFIMKYGMKTPFKCNLITVLFKTGSDLLVGGLKDGCGTWWKELKKNKITRWIDHTKWQVHCLTTTKLSYRRVL
jgi:hypothetical protein